ncbi:MAG TPA: hypothetical protein VGN83_12595 [Falsiroseomonas sp.]|nr:hypothetical protein [Falsiroseomonas sp.]
MSAAPAQPLDVEVRRSVVITDANVLRDTAATSESDRIDLSIGRTLGAIIASRSTRGNPLVDTPAERIALMTSLVRSFRTREQRHPMSDLTLPVAARPGEEALDPIQLLDEKSPNGLRLVGAFNRLDLAPSDWSNCGEHRLVYAKGDPVSPIDRLLVIFEARVENPDPTAGAAGCRPIADFWDGLRGKTGRELTRALEQFYFNGDTNSDDQPDLVYATDENGDGEEDRRGVIHARHLGLGLGQVRGNLFVTAGDPIANPWQLREWRVAASVGGAPVFEAMPVGSNPIPALYNAGQPPEGEPSPAAAFEALRAAFGDTFVETTVSRLTAFDRAALVPGGQQVTMDRLLNDMGAGFERRFDAFASVSQTLQDDPTEIARTGTLPGRLQARLAEFVLTERCGITPEHLLNRAGAMSCGGCHQFSSNRPIAQGINWPTTRPTGAPPGAPQFDFVHIDEAGQLSPALEERFLPQRRRHLEELLGVPAPAAMVARATAGAGADTRTMSSESSNAQRQSMTQSLRRLEPAETRATSGERSTAQRQSMTQSLRRLDSAETRARALQELQTLEDRIGETRTQEARQPGAFMPYRRVH